VRLFVAVDPSPEVKAAAASIAAVARAALDRRSGGHKIRWVTPENLHLTIWFLGEVSDQRAPLILESLSAHVAEPPFVLRLAGLGMFPPSGSPRVIWMGVAAGLEALARLHEAVGERLVPWGFKPEGRPYSAHLTLARIKEPVPPGVRAQLREWIHQVPAEAGSCSVHSLTVYRSRTSPSGASYEPLLRVPLS
jgi:RNA 2',3'-cyclic 3'-phosphodiesterase